MEDLWPLIAAVIFAVAAFVFGKKHVSPKKEAPSPPSDGYVPIVVGAIKKDLTDSVARRGKKLKGEDPAGDLADEGNARKRR